MREMGGGGGATDPQPFLVSGARPLRVSPQGGVDEKNPRRSIVSTRPRSWQATPGLRILDADRPALKRRPSLSLPIPAPVRWLSRLSSGERRQMPANIAQLALRVSRRATPGSLGPGPVVHSPTHAP